MGRGCLLCICLVIKKLVIVLVFIIFLVELGKGGGVIGRGDKLKSL